jgi:hypothetical protein
VGERAADHARTDKSNFRAGHGALRERGRRRRRT